MTQNVLQKLVAWQKAEAQRRGIASYRVIPFKTLEALAQRMPTTEEALLSVPGIGPAKAAQYGAQLLHILHGSAEHVAQAHANETTDFDTVNALLEQGASTQEPHRTLMQKNAEHATSSNTPVSVSEFVEHVNHVLGAYFGDVRISGEIVGFKRNQNGHAYFEIKDEAARVRVSVFRGAYERSGVAMEDGMEVIITGKPEHHARYGFSVLGSFVELAGEGALKKAYNDLKKKLTEEGLLAEERKRQIPQHPQRIGVITSASGAALGDFMANVGVYGYQIILAAVVVEGPKAVEEILQALEDCSAQQLDVLVVTRGGGSLESLAPFNNENVVRAVAAYPVPVIAGIGHEQDETLTTLVADYGASTPTGAARAVRASWDHVREQLMRQRQQILQRTQWSYDQAQASIGGLQSRLRSLARVVQEQTSYGTARYHSALEQLRRHCQHTRDLLQSYDKRLTAHSPEQRLAEGYSIIRDAQGVVVCKKRQAATGTKITAMLQDGTIDAKVIK